MVWFAGHPNILSKTCSGCTRQLLRQVFNCVSQHMTVLAFFCDVGYDDERLDKSTLSCRPCGSPLKFAQEFEVPTSPC